MIQSMTSTCLPMKLMMEHPEALAKFTEIEGLLDLEIYDLALTTLQAMPEELRQNRAYFHAMAMIAIHLKLWDSLDNCCKALFESFEGDQQPHYYLWQAVAFDGQGRHEKALDVLDQCLERHPEFSPAKFNKVVIEHQRGNDEVARNLARQLVDQHRDERSELMKNKVFKKLLGG